MLLAAGADVACESKNRRATALHLAVIMNHEDSVDALLTHASATKTAKDALLCEIFEPNRGRRLTALILAVVRGHKDIVDRLLSAGAVVDTQESHSGCAALHFAAASGREDVVEALLLHHAEVNGLARHPSGTSLHFAAGYGHVEATKKLLSAGADINSVNSIGQTPLDAAESDDYARTTRFPVGENHAGCTLIAELLKSKGAKTGREISKP